MLSRARRLPGAPGWRSGVLSVVGGPAAGAVPDVAVAARAMPALPAGAGLCFATPVHVVAGMSRVHLPPGGWLQLEAVEAVRWQEAFNRDFGGADLHLHAIEGGWILEAPCAAATQDAAPEELIGLPLTRSAASTEAQRALRRLGAEVEIWLTGHALNREREARNVPPLNSLWFWGGAHATQLPQLTHPLRHLLVAGEPDPWLTGLAAHCGLAVTRATNWQSLPLNDNALLVLSPSRWGMSAQHWQALESQWLAPAARSLVDGSIRSLHLQIGTTAWQLPWRSLLRWLRRRRPWHEQVAA